MAQAHVVLQAALAEGGPLRVASLVKQEHTAAQSTARMFLVVQKGEREK